jgi:hypothetical protein
VAFLRMLFGDGEYDKSVMLNKECSMNLMAPL